MRKTSHKTGYYIESTAGGEKVNAFVPAPLPPESHSIALALEASRLTKAKQALVRLDVASEMVPSLDWFIYAFVRKEAVITSQIEGTQATLDDLLAFEAEGNHTTDEDVEEICNYVKALHYARAQLAAKKGLPLSIRLLNEAHRRLVGGARGANKQPGEIRRSQNWIGGSRPGNAIYVPPPPDKVMGLLDDLERYIHAHDALPPLVRAGLIHVQFETIHPYLDGNGRMGRLLVALLLEHWGLLKQPALYLSLFFKRHRAEYYRRLNAVRTDGDWEGWLDFFLDGVATIADEAVTSARDLFGIVARDREGLLENRDSSAFVFRLFEQLPRHPIVTVASAMKLIDGSKPTAIRAIGVLQKMRVLVETTGKRRDRSFSYDAYLARLREGTDLETLRR
jgi:Fic family protein